MVGDGGVFVCVCVCLFVCVCVCVCVCVLERSWSASPLMERRAGHAVLCSRRGFVLECAKNLRHRRDGGLLKCLQLVDFGSGLAFRD